MRCRILVVMVIASALLTATPALAAAPKTTITKGPSGPHASRTVSFAFKADVQGANFQCKFDGGGWGGCSSPWKYTKLAQGQHTFSVRAVKGGAVDQTPATRTFTVDTIPPDTTIQSGPTGPITDHSPSFTFTSSEGGTFRCRLLSSVAFKKCTSPFSPADPLEDGSYDFEVRARDAAGNLDPTPDSRSFQIETPLVADLATAEAAAEMYFPDEMVMDVAPQCTSYISGTKIDCPNDPVTLPASDQLRITSSRAVTATVVEDTYDVTVTVDVETLREVVITFGSSTHCGTALTSAYGETPTWEVTVPLQFQDMGGPGVPRIVHQGVNVSGVEIEDWGVESWGEFPMFQCGRAGFFDSAYVEEVFREILRVHTLDVGFPLCAAQGPEYLGPCP